MQDEFFESREVRFFLHLLALQKSCVLKTLDRGMNLRGAHVEILNYLIRRSEYTNQPIFIFRRIV